MTTLKEYRKHAERFGGYRDVYETASDNLAPVELANHGAAMFLQG
jgi:hypothetical protein